MNFHATVTPHGLEWAEIEAMKKMLSKHVGKTSTVSFGFEKSLRTPAENRYYHGVIIEMLCEKTGYDPDEMHEILKSAFLTTKVRLRSDKRRKLTKVGSTASLNTDEFWIYANKCRELGKTLKVYIPLPNEAPLWNPTSPM